MKRKSIFYALALCSVMSVFTACEDMFDLTSSSVQYENNHELDSPADSLYSVVGILAKLQESPIRPFSLVSSVATSLTRV